VGFVAEDLYRTFYGGRGGVDRSLARWAGRKRRG
jgi:hypothetical protein